MQNKKNRLIIFGLMLFISFDVVPSSLSDDGYDSDRSFKDVIATHIDMPGRINPRKRKALEVNSVDPELQYHMNFSADSMNTRSLAFENHQIEPRCLMNDFIEEVVELNFVKAIENHDNQELVPFLQLCKQQRIVPVNQNQQNPAHIAARTPGAESSLSLIARINPYLFTLQDAQGKLPQDLIPWQSKRNTAKWKTVFLVQAAINLTISQK